MTAACEGFTAAHCLSLMFLIEARQKGRLNACLTNPTALFPAMPRAGMLAVPLAASPTCHYLVT